MIKRKTDEHAQRLRPIVERIQKEGHVSLLAIATVLNAGGYLSPRGGKWYAPSVSNLLVRLAVAMEHC